jgi:hypothetical protein
MMERPPTPGETLPGPRRGAVWLGTLAGLFLGGVFFVATWGYPPFRLGKVADPEAFAQVIRIEGLDFAFSSFSTAILALGIEAAVAFFLLLGVRRLWVLLPTAGLVAFFLFINGKAYYNWKMGGDVAEMSCGCFGNLVDRNPEQAFWQDFFLLVPPLLLAFLGRPRPGTPAPTVRIAVAGLLTVGTVVFSASAPDLALSDLATRLRPGVNVERLCVGDAEDPSNYYCLAGPALAPGLTEGKHVVILADLSDEDFREDVADRSEEILEFAMQPDAPQLLVVHAGSPEDQTAFQWAAKAPPFEYLVVPEALLRPLHRRLPRTFVVRDGEVTSTYEGLPRLADLAVAGSP